MVALLLVSLLLWWFAGPSLLRRTLQATVEFDEPIESLALNWHRSGVDRAHGVWLEDDQAEPAWLEIRPSGSPHVADAGFEFWLYGVKDSRGQPIDLKAAIKSTDTDLVKGRWIPFEQGPGVVYVGREPGLLRLRIPTSTASVNFARTSLGGSVELKFRYDTVALDTYAERGAGEILVVPTTTKLDGALHVLQALPAYTIENLTLDWKGTNRASIKVVDASVHFDLLGLRFTTRPIAPAVIADCAAVGGGAFKANGALPSVRLGGNLSPGIVGFALGWGALFLILSGVTIAARAARKILAAMRRSRRIRALALLSVILAGNLVIAMAIPVMVTPDGIDYIDGAAGLAFAPHDLDRMPLYKAPGLMFVLAVAMVCDTDFLGVFAIIQAFFAVAMSASAYWLLARRTSTAWAGLAAFLVGFHPILITYQCYLLRENIAAATFTLVAVGILALERTPDASNPRRSMLLSVTLGVICGLGALLRENFQILLLVVPLAILWACPARLPRRALLAGVAFLVAVLTILPWLATKSWPAGAWGITVAKTQGNRAINVYTNKVADGNDTAFLSPAQWKALQQDIAAGKVNDYEFGRRLFDGEILADPSVSRILNPDAIFYEPRNTERVNRMISDEAVARRPLAQARAVGVSFVNQLGLWNFYRPEGAATSVFYSMPLRGRRSEYSTNYAFNSAAMLNDRRFDGREGRLQGLIDASRRTIENHESSPWATFFNEVFWMAYAARPIVAVLFLYATWLAWRRRERAFVAIGLIVLFFMASAAAVVAPAADRFAAPFIPAMLCLALYAVATWSSKPVRA